MAGQTYQESNERFVSLQTETSVTICNLCTLCDMVVMEYCRTPRMPLSSLSTHGRVAPVTRSGNTCVDCCCVDIVEPITANRIFNISNPCRRGPPPCRCLLAASAQRSQIDQQVMCGFEKKKKNRKKLLCPKSCVGSTEDALSICPTFTVAWFLVLGSYVAWTCI